MHAAISADNAVDTFIASFVSHMSDLMNRHWQHANFHSPARRYRLIIDIAVVDRGGSIGRPILNDVSAPGRTRTSAK